jgi:DNA-binding CsgD family transcriptional regulator
VRTLSARDASALLAFVAELHDAQEPMAFPPRLLARLQQLIPSDAVGYSELDPSAQESILQVWYDADGDHEVIAGNERAWNGDEQRRKLWWRVRDGHPVCGYRASTGDWTTPYKNSDFATLAEFRRTAYCDVYSDAVYRWLDVGLAATASRTRVFILTRDRGHDFDDRDRLVLELLQPHLADRAEVAAMAARGAAALAAVEETGGVEAGSVVLCSASGVIEFASPAARALLRRYLGLENGRVAEAVLRQREIRLTHAERRLHIRTARTGALHVLVLDERDTRVERLTAREREILDRVALGKDNEAIALELAISPRTVAKHLEHIYRKLGVPNRTAAAALLESR